MENPQMQPITPEQRERYARMFFYPNTTLTTRQIKTAIRNADMTHDDWMEFVHFMKLDQ